MPAHRQNCVRPRNELRRRGRIERLEQRLALDSQGVLAGFDPHFTLSFVDDGVAIGADPSTLNATLDGLATRSEWREAVLRAFQTWAVHTNADIGVVADGGQPFGAPGASQGDSRFGDIRIGATELSAEVGAVSVPIDNVASGTWLADVLFNTAFDYQNLDQFLAVAMHEAGNVFGLEDNNTVGSPLNTGVAPTLNDPTATDIALLQSLHGVRSADASEVHNGDSGPQLLNNNTLANATKLDVGHVTGVGEGSAPTIVYGDIHDNADLDYFVIDPPGDYHGPMTARLRTSGVSLLQPSLMVLNEAGQLVAEESSNTVGGALLSVQLPSVTVGQKYTFRVAGADPGVFGIGGYSLAVTFDGLNAIDEARISEVASGGVYRTLSRDDLAKLFDAEDEFYNDDGGTNETASMGTELCTTNGFIEGTRYQTLGSITSTADVDFYLVKSPRASAGPFDVLTVTVRSLDTGRLVPAVTVLDEDQNPVASETIVNGAGEVIVQVEGAAANKDFYLRVAADGAVGAFNQGNYELTVSASTDPAVLNILSAGDVGGVIGQSTDNLFVARPQLFHLVLSAGPLTSASPLAVVATVRDSLGSVVTRVAAAPGQTRSAPAVLLDIGSYTITYTALSLDGSAASSIGYELRGLALSDPFVGDPQDPTGNPFYNTDPNIDALFVYPGGFPSDDPFLWNDFVASQTEPPPPLPTDQLVNLLIGDWWSWVWQQIGINGPTLAQNDRFDVIASGSIAQSRSFAAITVAPNVLANDFDPEGGAVVALLLTGPAHGVLQLDPDGTVHYTPDPGYVGADHFTYTAYDFTQESTPATAYLVVGTGITGDFNGDGAVDLLDRDAWRISYGSSDALLADGNRDMVIDAADYSVWRDAYESVQAPAVTAAPIALIQADASVTQPGSPTLRSREAGHVAPRQARHHTLHATRCLLLVRPAVHDIACGRAESVGGAELRAREAAFAYYDAREETEVSLRAQTRWRTF